MRTINDHVVPGDLPQNQLRIVVSDEPGQGGANHAYAICWSGPVVGGPDDACYVNFQNGPIKEFGLNGITQESLLAIVIDRLRSFQSGPFSCRENAIALTHCEDALMWLQRRTVNRLRRGVEGTNQQ
jgi:hypothetical protein